MSELSGELRDLINGLAKDGRNAGRTIQDQWLLVGDLGLAAIGIAEDAGGSGGALDDLLLAVQELARVGIDTPIVEASTAAYATGVVPGSGFDTVVLDDELVVSDSPLTAAFPRVPFVSMADRLIVVTGTAVIAVPLAQETVVVDAAYDIAGLPSGSVRLDGAQCEPVGAKTAPADVGDRLALARASAIVGCARGAYELTRSYVTEREQFGAPLLKIPAVSSTLAQMLVRLQMAQAAVDRAVNTCCDSTASSPSRYGAVSAARIVTAQTATLIARGAHQLHGAVGVTEEYGLHRLTRRLWAWRDADRAERAYANGLGERTRAVGESALWDELSGKQSRPPSPAEAI